MSEGNDIRERTDRHKMRWQATASDIPEIAACVHDDTANRKTHDVRNRERSDDIDRCSTPCASPSDARPVCRSTATHPVQDSSRLVRWISHDAGYVRSWPPATSSSPRPTPTSWSTKSKKSSALYYCAPSASRSSGLRDRFCDINRRSRTRVHHHLRTLRPIRNPAQTRQVTQNAVRLMR